MNDTIHFAETEPSDIESNIITTYEALSGKKLYAGDPVRLFLKAIAQLIVQQRVLIDFGAKQNLLSYATDGYLDEVVALVGVKRLAASPSRATVRFTLSATQQSVIAIPKGTRVKAGELYFITIEASEIAAGTLTEDVIVECMEAGIKGNGFMPGQINELVDVFPFFASVSNITESSGGTDVEEDDALRERAFEAPNSFSTAGSDSAYAFWAKTLSPGIIDVTVTSPNPGEVEIIPIGNNGELISEELMQQVLERCSDKNVKPLTDSVTVVHPTQVNYSIDVSFYIAESDVASSNVIQKQVEAAVEEFITWQHSKLGRNINPSALTHRLMKAGAERVVVTQPVFKELTNKQVAKVTTTNIVYGGVEYE